MYSVVIPNKFEDVIQPLLASLRKFEPKAHVVIVADNHSNNYGHSIVKMKGPFNFSASVNAGIKFTEPSDIILMNDDASLVRPNTFERLEEAAYSDSEIGILSPLVDGGCGNRFQRVSESTLWERQRSNFHFCNARGGDRVTFACVYIKRACIESIGLFDEGFRSDISYGFDDADMSIRCVKGGWKLAITNLCTIRHGKGGEKFIRGVNWNTSFKRVKAVNARINLKYLTDKYTGSVFVK